MPKLKFQNKWDMSARIISSIVILLIFIQAVIYSFSIREWYNIDRIGIALFSSSAFRLDHFIIDFIFRFAGLIGIAMFPMAIIFSDQRNKLACLIYLILMAIFSVEYAVSSLTVYGQIVIFDIFALISEICCCISAGIIMIKPEKLSLKITASLLQLPYILVGVTECINYFSLFNLIQLLISPLFVIYLFSLNSDIGKVSLKNGGVFFVTCILLNCIHLITLVLFNFGFIN